MSNRLHRALCISLKIKAAGDPENACQTDDSSDEIKGCIPTRVANLAKQWLRDGISKHVNHENVESKCSRAHLWMSHVCQNRIRRAGVEEEEKLGDGDKDPSIWKRRFDQQNHKRHGDQHADSGDQEVGAFDPS